MFNNKNCTKIVDNGLPLVIDMEQVSFCNTNLLILLTFL